MELNIPVLDGLSLKVADQLSRQGSYATSSLPKGFILVSNRLELDEEAVGFGFPVIKRGLQTLLPGSVELAYEHVGSAWSVQSIYRLNLVEKIHKPGVGSIDNGLVYATKNSLAALIRHFSPMRGLLTALSSGLRKTFGWQTTYEEAGFLAIVKVTHRIQEGTGKIQVEVEQSDLPAGITEGIVMNEQGARYFDRYSDSSGISLKEEGIGCWDEVTADNACFSSSSGQASFSLARVESARLFRGRELVGSRLAWSGFGYSFSSAIKKFNYQLKIERQE